MVKATLWIDGVKYCGRGETNNYALDALNERWQLHCKNDPNSDKRRISQLAEHIKYTNE